MNNQTRLTKLEATIKPQLQEATQRGPGVATKERMQRVLKAIAAHSEKHGPFPPVDWSQPYDNPTLEAIRMKVLMERSKRVA